MADDLQIHSDAVFAQWSATIVTKLEHIESKQDEQASTLESMRTKLDMVNTDMAVKTQRMEKIEDLDKRVSVLEKKFWMAVGVMGFLAISIPMLVQYLK